MIRRIKPTRRQLRESFISGYKKALKEKRLLKEGLNPRIIENIAREVTHEFSVNLSTGLRYIYADTFGDGTEAESVEEYVDLLLPEGTPALDKYIDKACKSMSHLTIKAGKDFDYMACVDKGIRSAVNEYVENGSDWFMWGLSRPSAKQTKEDLFDALLERVREIVDERIDHEKIERYL